MSRSPAVARARFSSAVAIRPDGATILDGTAGASVLGSGVSEVSARYQTTSALAITMMIRIANSADRVPCTVEFVTTVCISARLFAGASTSPRASAAA